jgi:sulfur-oxidizing protein SoxY
MPVASRRSFLMGAAMVTVLPFEAARATPEALAQLIKEVVGTAQLREGKVRIDVPPLIENGNTVPLTVTVDSPMSDADYVKAIHLFTEKNPQPHVFSATLTPRNGKARIGARIKLADTQKIVAIAETSDGSFWSASAEVIVTIAACIEDVN